MREIHCSVCGEIPVDDDMSEDEFKALRLRHDAKHGITGNDLPVVEVTWDPETASTTVRYPGKIHGVIEGRESWSDNGTFTVDLSAYEFRLRPPWPCTGCPECEPSSPE